MGLNTASAFKAHLTRATNKKWVVFAKRPFAGPEQVLAYLARYTNRVAISNHVAFRWKDYREDGSYRSEVMPLAPHEFMRRFLLHVLPDGFHRIRHYGLFANGHRAEKLALCRKLLDVSAVAAATSDERDNADDPVDGDHPPPCPCCGGRMKIIETFERINAAHVRDAGHQDRHLIMMSASEHHPITNAWPCWLSTGDDVLRPVQAPPPRHLCRTDNRAALERRNTAARFEFLLRCTPSRAPRPLRGSIPPGAGASQSP